MYNYVYNFTWGEAWVTFSTHTDTNYGGAGADHLLVSVLAGPWADTSAFGVVRKRLFKAIVDRGSFTSEEAAGPNSVVEASVPDLACTACEQERWLEPLGFSLLHAGSAGVSKADNMQPKAWRS